MATKKQSKKSIDKPESGEVVTRIKAGGETSVKKSAKKPTKAESTAPKVTEKKQRFRVLRSIGGYFKGAWTELRLVRWPTRRATWSMTGAVLAFSAFFVILIVLLDLLFQYLFDQILG